MDDYLAKPFTRDDLRRMIEKWVHHRRGPIPPAAEAPREEPPTEPAAKQPAPKSGPPVDTSVLAELQSLEGEDGSDLLLRVIETFLTFSAKLLSAAREAFAADDPDAVARAAHTLKSSSAQLGAERLSALCRELEARGRAHSLDGVQEILEQINVELEAVHEHLSAQLPGARDA